MPNLMYTSHRGQPVYRVWNPLEGALGESVTRVSPTPHEIQSYLDQLALTLHFDRPQAAEPLRRARQWIVARYYYSVQSRIKPRVMHQIARCSDTYAMWLIDGKPTVAPMHCHKRACPICQQARQLQLRDRYRKALAKMSAPKHITLTTRSSDAPLGTQIQYLIWCFAHLRRRKIWRDRTPWGAWTVEITYNPTTRQYHPHLHIICNMRYLPWQQLRTAWHKITRGSWACWIRSITGPVEPVLSFYIAKASAIYTLPVDILDLDQQLHRRRMVQPFGTWPIPTGDEFHYAYFVGTVPEILHKAARGRWEYRLHALWLLRHHPYAIAAALDPPDPLEGLP